MQTSTQKLEKESFIEGYLAKDTTELEDLCKQQQETIVAADKTIQDLTAEVNAGKEQHQIGW